jgi:hypothetical protein
MIDWKYSELEKEGNRRSVDLIGFCALFQLS